jgi:hypothetical protein
MMSVRDREFTCSVHTGTYVSRHSLKRYSMKWPLWPLYILHSTARKHAISPVHDATTPPTHTTD